MKPRISQLAKTTRGQQTAPALRARQDYLVATLGKSAKCVALFLESIKMLQPKTWSRYNTIILVYVIELPLPQILWSSSQMDLIVNCHDDVFQGNFTPLK